MPLRAGPKQQPPSLLARVPCSPSREETARTTRCRRALRTFDPAFARRWLAGWQLRSRRVTSSRMGGLRLENPIAGGWPIMTNIFIPGDYRRADSKRSSRRRVGVPPRSLSSGCPVLQPVRLPQTPPDEEGCQRQRPGHRHVTRLPIHGVGRSEARRRRLSERTGSLKRWKSTR